uniref:SLP adaptor and CSK interacting membrane protein n=1 Tax=Suricata suricatta TaxID=37032 RepID=A0A673V5U3_SURSU
MSCADGDPTLPGWPVGPVSQSIRLLASGAETGRQPQTWPPCPPVSVPWEPHRGCSQAGASVLAFWGPGPGCRSRGCSLRQAGVRGAPVAAPSTPPSLPLYSWVVLGGASQETTLTPGDLGVGACPWEPGLPHPWARRKGKWGPGSLLPVGGRPAGGELGVSQLRPSHRTQRPCCPLSRSQMDSLATQGPVAMDWWRDNFFIILAAAIVTVSVGLALILYCVCRQLLRQGKKWHVAKPSSGHRDEEKTYENVLNESPVQLPPLPPRGLLFPEHARKYLLLVTFRVGEQIHLNVLAQGHLGGSVGSASDSSSSHDLTVHGFELCVGLFADSLVPGACWLRVS